MSSRIFGLAVVLVGCAAPVLAAAPTEVSLDMQWARGLQKSIAGAVSGVRRTLPKGSLVKLSFTVIETGDLVSVRGEEDPRAVERVTAAVRKLGHVRAPPDHMAHPISVPIRVK